MSTTPLPPANWTSLACTTSMISSSTSAKRSVAWRNSPLHELLCVSQKVACLSCVLICVSRRHPSLLACGQSTRSLAQNRRIVSDFRHLGVWNFRRIVFHASLQVESSCYRPLLSLLISGTWHWQASTQDFKSSTIHAWLPRARLRPKL